MLGYDHDDATLVMLTLAGDQRAYEALVTRYERAVTLAATAVAGNSYMAEDAAQDAFVSAWLKLNTLAEPEKFAPWVCRIAKNCAKNAIMRYRSFMPLEELSNLNLEGLITDDPASAYVSSEESAELRKTVEGLPEKVRNVIRLHYFEGLSVAQIAERMGITESTVKWQLHDGRKRMRKELCAVNESINDTLVQRVMKKVEELKLWQYKNSKNGFEQVYRDVLAEVESLPESADKSHALADVLMRGFWWVTGEKNDALFARIKAAAEEGRNDEVMEFVTIREEEKFYGVSKLSFMTDIQIPRLEAGGFVHALGAEWLRVADIYFDLGKDEKGMEATENAIRVLPCSDHLHARALALRDISRKRIEGNIPYNSSSHNRMSGGSELRFSDGEVRFYKESIWYSGHLYSTDLLPANAIRCASHCDGYLTRVGLAVGESIKGSDGMTLTFEGREDTDTPAGRFEDCEVWVTRHPEGHVTIRTHIKDGVGIVRIEQKKCGTTDTCHLSAYDIRGGRGKLPLAVGNRWEYVSDHDPSTLCIRAVHTVTYEDGERAVISTGICAERHRYDENSFADMMAQIRSGYFREIDGTWRVCDVSRPIARARELAKTPLEKALAYAAGEVALRIMSTSRDTAPDTRKSGHWNFFELHSLSKTEGKINSYRDFRLSFELKNMGGFAEHDRPLLFNDIYGILEDAAGSLWCDEWRDGYELASDRIIYNQPIKTHVKLENIGGITVAAGHFDSCLKMSINVEGFEDGFEYRGGKKEYYFAEGVGIVRTVNEYFGGHKKAVYELTSYEGRGEGYMPLCHGLVRRYEAIGLTDGFVGAAEYIHVEENGELYVIDNRTGIRDIRHNVTEYSFVERELLEESLWEQDKKEESRALHDVSAFHRIIHFMNHPGNSHYRGLPKRATAWNKHRLAIIETLSADGSIPEAWQELYTVTAFRTACSLFGQGERDEGYIWMEKAFKLAESMKKHKKGDLLEVGDPLIFGGVKLVYGEDAIELSSGSREPITEGWAFRQNVTLLHHGITAEKGWEWFDPVRHEELYGKYVERARAILKKYNEE